jgi:hypothetical protein
MKDEKDFKIENEDDLEGMEIVTLYDEERQKEIDFEEIAAINYNDKLYVFLTPVETNEDIEEGEVVIMEAVEDENGEETLLPVTDEALLNAVFEEFQKEIDACDDEDCEECDCGCHEHEHKKCDCGCEDEE